MMALSFLKMQALGNDFILIHETSLSGPLTKAHIRFLCDRRQGVGCDQLILLKAHPTADVEISFYNGDGSPALACGNGTRCVAKYLNKPEGTIQTPSGLSSFWNKENRVTISFKTPSAPTPLPQGYRVDVGNPHQVIFVDDLGDIDLSILGPQLQPPEGINVEIAQILSPTHIGVKVWERGVGITPACGSGACAVGFCALHIGRVTSPLINIQMDGGGLDLEIKGDMLLLSGPAMFCFEGLIELS